MAISNVRSSAYRAAGGWKSWGRTKGQDNSVRMDGPVPPHIELHFQEKADTNDSYHLTKAEVRARLAESDLSEVPVTIVPEGMTAKKAKKQGFKKKKHSKPMPGKRPNRRERRALQKKVEQERLDKKEQFK